MNTLLWPPGLVYTRHTSGADLMSQAHPAAFAAADGYLTTLARYRHAASSDPIALARGPECGQLMDALRDQLSETQDAVLARLCDGLARLPDPMAAGVLAIQVGGWVEGGAAPVPLAEALRSRLPGDYAAARRYVELLEADTGSETPDAADAEATARTAQREPTGAAAWAALQYSTPAGMAAWCRHRPSRQAAKATPGLADGAVWLGARGGYCQFIGDMLGAADGTRMTVLSPEQKKGFEVELEVVRNAAHLFVLLEDTLVGDPAEGLLSGPQADPDIAAIARGEGEAQHGMTFNVGWHYEYWWGLKPEAVARASGLHPLIAAMIGVEATIDEIPPFEGQQVIFMRPPLIGSRSCDIAFFAPLHDALRSRVTIVRCLPPVEVEQLSATLTAAAERT